MNASDFARRLADKLIEQLKAGKAPWQQDWVEGQRSSPYNPTAGKRYRGINILALMATGRSDPRWMTYRQAQAQGWQVRRGEKGTQIQHWICEEIRTRLGKDGSLELDKDGNPIKDLVRLARPKVMAAAVFNAEQIDGIPGLEPVSRLEWNPVDKAEKLLRASQAKIEHSQVGGAFYRVGTDTIHLPGRERFTEAAAYYAVALHELGHWTGHPDRLNRDQGHPFGTEGYAREELRAEIASMITGSELGIGYDHRQHAGYVDHWVKILTDTPTEILYAAADAEKISEYILTLEQKREVSQTQETTEVKEQISHAERIYLAVPYEERQEAKALGARWDAVKKAWYVGPGVEPEEIAKWELRHQGTATLDPRVEFAEVLRSIGGIIEGEHPIMDGKGYRLATEKDKRGEAAIFYCAYLDGIPNGYAENNRTKEVRRWKGRGQALSAEQRTELLAEAEKKRYERERQELERFEATATRLSADLRSLSFSGVQKTPYHEAKGIAPVAGAAVRNGDLLVPGYDVEGKLWTIQYIKEDGTKRFAKDSRKQGCFHVVDAATVAAALEKLSKSSVIAVAEGYATAATVAKYGKVPAVAAFDSGNLLAVARALHERWPDKQLMIAGDDDHKLENNPGRGKALEASMAVNGMVVFPNFTVEQREKGLTDFNDLALEHPRLAEHQLEEAVRRARQPERVREQSMEATIMGQVFGVILILGIVMGFVFRAQAQSGSNLSVLDVYSVKVPSDGAHEEKADLKPGTLEGYAKAFRKIVSDIFEIGDGNAKCDYWGGGFKEWLDKVHSVKLAEVTPERVQAWKRAFLAKAGAKPIRQRAAKISVNSFLRRAKSLFAPAAVKHLTVQLPTPLPFTGIAFEPKQQTLYRSSFDAPTLIQAARDELAIADPAAFLVVVLGLCVGLRKGEIDLLPWSAVRFGSGAIRIEPTEYFAPKTEHSIGDVPVDPEILELFRGFRARTKSPFVVPAGRRKPTHATSHQYYRCEPVFDRVLVWLRKHGVRGQKPLHALRKEYGSLIHEKFDLVTAKELLRHSSVAITAAHYVENRKRGTTGLGALLAKDRKIIPIEESTATAKEAAKGGL